MFVQTGVQWHHVTYIAVAGAAPARKAVVGLRELLLRLAKGRHGKTLKAKVPLQQGEFQRMVQLAGEHFSGLHQFLTQAPLTFVAVSRTGNIVARAQYNHTGNAENDTQELFARLQGSLQQQAPAASNGGDPPPVSVGLATHISRVFVRSIAAKGVMLTAVYGSLATTAATLRQAARNIDLRASAWPCCLCQQRGLLVCADRCRHVLCTQGIVSYSACVRHSNAVCVVQATAKVLSDLCPLVSDLYREFHDHAGAFHSAVRPLLEDLAKRTEALQRAITAAQR